MWDLESTKTLTTRIMVACWLPVVLVFLFVVLRAFTRVRYISVYGADDVFFVVSFVLLLTTVATFQVAMDNGGGGNEQLLPDHQHVATDLWQTVAEAFAILTTATCKAAVGWFLLRLVGARWQRVAILSLVGLLAAVCLVSAILTFTICTPFAAKWDFRIEGHCGDSPPVVVMFAMLTIILDLAFAIVPWLLVWKLPRPRLEKFLIAGSLSLGVIAAAMGIARIVVLVSGDDTDARNYTGPSGFIESFVWTVADITATLVGVGISSTVPIYRAIWQRLRHHTGSTELQELDHQYSGHALAALTGRGAHHQTTTIAGAGLPARYHPYHDVEGVSCKDGVEGGAGGRGVHVVTTFTMDEAAAAALGKKAGGRVERESAGVEGNKERGQATVTPQD